MTGGHTDVVRFLLSVGANPDIHIENQEQCTLFDSKPYELTTEVLASGKLSFTQALLDKGAPVNEPEESLSQ